MRIRTLMRWGRRHPEAALLPAALGTVLTTGFSFSLELPLYLLLLVGVVLATGWAFRRWPGPVTGGRLHLRLATQVAAVALVVYATGWGAALSLAFVFAIADNVRHSGAAAARPALDWSLVAIALGQLGIQLGVVPSAFDAPAVHGVAVTAAVALAVVTQRIHLLTSRSEAAEERIRASEQRFRALVTHAADVVLVLDKTLMITYQGASAGSVLGFDADALLGAPVATLVHPDDLPAVRAQLRDLVPGDRMLLECRARHGDGRWVAAEIACQDRTSDPDVDGYVLNIRDVSERKELEAQLHHRAFHDALTGLANRHLFRDRVQHAVARGLRRQDPFAVLFIDLDGFKLVNDTLGHAAGDELLAVVAHRIRRAIREHDTAARLGGDEFAVLLEDMSDQSDAARVAERVLGELRAPLEIGGSRVHVDASIGIAVGPVGDDTTSERAGTEELLRNADIAMYMAKGAGKGRYEIFEPSMHVAVVERLRVESDLQTALSDGQFELHYQPMVTLDDGAVVGVEALLRWNHPERGMISPGEFVPLAEESGLIVPIGAWALREACHQAKAWQERYPHEPPLRISVNVSPRQITHGDLAADVRRALDLSGLAPEHLTLEITESALMADTDRTIALFQELKALGVRLAVDDFGTGYSSLAYLQRFPFDVLKIDRSFIDGLTRGTQSPALVRAIIDLGRSLKLATVAEGIEHDEQLSRFRELHCNYGQGYLFARPARGADLEAFFADRFEAVTEPALDVAPQRERA